MGVLAAMIAVAALWAYLCTRVFGMHGGDRSIGLATPPQQPPQPEEKAVPSGILPDAEL